MPVAQRWKFGNAQAAAQAACMRALSVCCPFPALHLQPFRQSLFAISLLTHSMRSPRCRSPSWWCTCSAPAGPSTFFKRTLKLLLIRLLQSEVSELFGVVDVQRRGEVGRAELAAGLIDWKAFEVGARFCCGLLVMVALFLMGCGSGARWGALSWRRG